MKIKPGQNKLSSEGLGALDATNFPNLQYLYLSQNQITDEGAAKLASSPWRSLFVIMLCTSFLTNPAYNLITNSGAESLTKSKWAAIEAVFLDSNQITKKRQELKFSNPDTFVFV